MKESELDAEGFDAEAYVKDALAKQDLAGVLRAEAALINRKTVCLMKSDKI